MAPRPPSPFPGRVGFVGLGIMGSRMAANVPFGAAARAREVLVAALARGHPDGDFAALVEALEGFASIRLDR